MKGKSSKKQGAEKGHIPVQADIQKNKIEDYRAGYLDKYVCQVEACGIESPYFAVKPVGKGSEGTVKLPGAVQTDTVFVRPGKTAEGRNQELF